MMGVMLLFIVVFSFVIEATAHWSMNHYLNVFRVYALHPVLSM